MFVVVGAIELLDDQRAVRLLPGGSGDRFPDLHVDHRKFVLEGDRRGIADVRQGKACSQIVHEGVRVPDNGCAAVPQVRVQRCQGCRRVLFVQIVRSAMVGRNISPLVSWLVSLSVAAARLDELPVAASNSA